MGIGTFSRQLVRDGDCSGENKKELNEKEHKERTHCGVQNDEGRLGHPAESGRECCFILTSIAT